MNLPSQHAYPIHSAAKYNSNDCVKPILKFDEQCAHVKDTKYGGTPLHWAKTRQVLYMKYKGSVLHLTIFIRFTNWWVSITCMHGHRNDSSCCVLLQTVELLLVADADIEAGNNECETPLHIMIRRKRLQCVVCLLSHGADVNALGMENDTPLHMAVKVGS